MRSTTIPPSNLDTPITPNTTTSSKSSTITSSPIPYLFGGLATIMCLIAFALLMLACSYWTQQQRDLEDNNNKECDEVQNKEPFKVYEEKILVIMAGDEKPTFLATPVCHNSSSSFVANNFNQNDPHKSEEKQIVNNNNHVVVVVDPAIGTQENASSQH